MRWLMFTDKTTTETWDSALTGHGLHLLRRRRLTINATSSISANRNRIILILLPAQPAAAAAVHVAGSNQIPESFLLTNTVFLVVVGVLITFPLHGMQIITIRILYNLTIIDCPLNMLFIKMKTQVMSRHRNMHLHKQIFYPVDLVLCGRDSTLPLRNSTKTVLGSEGRSSKTTSKFMFFRMVRLCMCTPNLLKVILQTNSIPSSSSSSNMPQIRSRMVCRSRTTSSSIFLSSQSNETEAHLEVRMLTYRSQMILTAASVSRSLLFQEETSMATAFL
mmetsp:Transcript_8186/g.20624  ORF Transcript_8186/g.20624 Transcript_8186/m.20624 type:complete len:277 (-) Transcript_8186:1647-2477(-)